MLLSTRLVRMIEDHADGLTQGIVEILRTNTRTASYQRLPEADVHRRAFGVYRNLGKWLTAMSDEEIEESYRNLAVARHEEHIPLSEVIYALTFTKYHLRDYISASGIIDSAVALAQEQELQFLIGRFFDKAIYYTAKGYEEAERQNASADSVAGKA
jgi:hypothetical protein